MNKVLVTLLLISAVYIQVSGYSYLDQPAAVSQTPLATVREPANPVLVPAPKVLAIQNPRI